MLNVTGLPLPPPVATSPKGASPKVFAPGLVKLITCGIVAAENV
jgi:hypothetical protein